MILSRQSTAAVVVASVWVLALVWLGSDARGFGLDSFVLTAVRHPADLSIPIGPPWLANFFLNITSLGSVAVVGTVVVVLMLFLSSSGRNRSVIFLLTSSIGAWIASNVLKVVVGRPRPLIVPHLVEVHDASFPSGHATLSMATCLGIGLIAATSIPKAGSLRWILVSAFMIVSLLVGFSRIFLGVHYPSDVAAGWIVGGGWTTVCWQQMRQRPI